MKAENLLNAILEKCDIYYGDALISKEAILKRYMKFFADSLVSKEHSINFAIHTGSVCFDIISVVAVSLGCFSYNLTTNDDIVFSLHEDDMIMFKGQRYRWKGTRTMEDKVYMMIEQDGKGKNGKTISYIPFEKSKHLIRPYYGDSKVTDGRGIRKKKTNREDFLAFVFGVNIEEIPTQVDVAIAIVAERNLFAGLYKQVRIVYGNNNEVSLSDILPAAYYTSIEEKYQFGRNPTKAEPVLKVTGKISTARDLVLDKHGNKVVGLLVAGITSLRDSNSELVDLLRRKTLRFVFITSPIKVGLSEYILNAYADASVFACTKTLLLKSNHKIHNDNFLTKELHQQIMNVINNTVTIIPQCNGWSWEKYKTIKNAIWSIKQSNWQEPLKDDFVMIANSLLNLLNTAVFPLEIMETAIQKGSINKVVVSPYERILKLWDIADRAGAMQELCAVVADALEQKYQEQLKVCPKADALKAYLEKHKTYKVTIIVPKAYYADLLRIEYPEYFVNENIICVTANRFDGHQMYDYILCVGEINNKRFDPLQCIVARYVDVFMYECEEKLFEFRRNKFNRYERRLNNKIGTAHMDDDLNIENSFTDIKMDADVRKFSALDEDIEKFKFFDIDKLTQNNTSSGNNVPISEVNYTGVFVTGEQIFFSKYYTAVVFDGIKGSVIEKTPEQLRSGDVLVFVKRDNYTKNIVDFIYERLLHDGYLEQGAIETYEKSLYWKEALREYKEINGFTYRRIAQKMQDLGSLIQEVTIRQWLIDDSHIVGPRKERTMEHIAIVTQDPYLLADPRSFFEACGAVRRDRRKILDLIAKAINDKLSGSIPQDGSVLSVIYNNVDRLSETLELESILELDKSVNINTNLVNTPITESEVLI